MGYRSMDSVEMLKIQIIKSRKRSEGAEVILSNLLKLRDVTSDSFTISHDDLVVTIEAVITMLKND